jgi:uncharacterized protein
MQRQSYPKKDRGKMDQVTIRAQTSINPTETQEKVQAAINNIIDNATFTTEPASKGSVLTATASGHLALSKFRNILRNDKIRDASRKQLLRSIYGNTISFFLNKQVAFAGHVSFCEETAESPLGPIKIMIETDTPEELVEWLAKKRD